MRNDERPARHGTCTVPPGHQCGTWLGRGVRASKSGYGGAAASALSRNFLLPGQPRITDTLWPPADITRFALLSVIQMLPNFVHVLTSRACTACASLDLFGLVLWPPTSHFCDIPGVVFGYRLLTLCWNVVTGLLPFLSHITPSIGHPALLSRNDLARTLDFRSHITSSRVFWSVCSHPALFSVFRHGHRARLQGFFDRTALSRPPVSPRLAYFPFYQNEFGCHALMVSSLRAPYQYELGPWFGHGSSTARQSSATLRPWSVPCQVCASSGRLLLSQWI